MDEKKIIEINGRKSPVAKIKHWCFAPHKFLPFQNPLETARWKAFLALRKAWDTLDVSILEPYLSPDFSYGSYWVKVQTLDRKGYLDHLL